MTKRIVCWFSCGAASAVATKIALGEFKDHEIIIAYTEVAEEHPDNKRFLADCEQWFGQKILILGNEKYEKSIYKVFEKNFIRTPKGAPCTRELKKRVRQRFEQLNDKQVFGYTAEEQARLDRFIDANNDVDIYAPLIEKGLGKEDCLAMLENAGIELPAMYKLGYHNNNCIGCVKGGMGYWNKIKIDFPEHFDRMAKLERFKSQTVFKDRYLDELKPTDGNYPSEPSIECSIFCHLVEQELNVSAS
jgi:3'-phosphoadenosine 5'-phosphosulfate sulfotransferase (PAPS reductase)/FAD synthetase